jgi:hypothetical protein
LFINVAVEAYCLSVASAVTRWISSDCAAEMAFNPENVTQRKPEGNEYLLPYMRWMRLGKLPSGGRNPACSQWKMGKQRMKGDCLQQANASLGYFWNSFIGDDRRFQELY